MATGATGVKRARESEMVMATYSAAHCSRGPVKRVRRISDSHGTDLATILKSDVGGFTKFPARAAFLQSLNISDSTILGLLQGLGSDYTAFLSIIDLNLLQRNVMDVVNDFSARGVSMIELNIRGHSFCMGDKELILKSFASSYRHHRWVCDVSMYVGRNIFAEDTKLSINVLSGGGVRDVLIAEWCAAYKVKRDGSPTQLVFVISETGRRFLIPLIV